MERYVIEIVYFRTRTRYQLKTVINGLVVPVNGKNYQSEADARKAADELGITIDRVGTLWEII